MFCVTHNVRARCKHETPNTCPVAPNGNTTYRLTEILLCIHLFLNSNDGGSLISALPLGSKMIKL